MNSIKNIVSLLSIVFFAGLGFFEVIIKKTAITSPSVVLILIMIVFMVLCRFVFVTKFNPGNKELLNQASSNLNGVNLPLGFLGGLTLVVSALFLVSTLGLVAKIIVPTLPAILGTVLSVLAYVLIMIIPVCFILGMLNGKYGNGMDFMLYSLGVLVYIIQGYIGGGSLNVFACGQFVLALTAWDILSGLNRTEAPAPKAPKEKKEKVPKKDKKSKEEVAAKEAETTQNKEAVEAFIKEEAAQSELNPVPPTE